MEIAAVLMMASVVLGVFLQVNAQLGAAHL
jgi:hypothetical protein